MKCAPGQSHSPASAESSSGFSGADHLLTERAMGSDVPLFPLGSESRLLPTGELRTVHRVSSFGRVPIPQSPLTPHRHSAKPRVSGAFRYLFRRETPPVAEAPASVLRRVFVE